MDKDFKWVCNECGSHEYSSSISDQDLNEWLACSNCGCTEFHKEYIENNDKFGGYQRWNLLGYKIKKDGTPGSRLVPIVLKKEKL